MASIFQYVRVMRNAQYVIAKRLGPDIAYADVQTRAVLLSNLAVQAVLLKVLVAKGVVTDAELLGALNALRNDPFQVPLEPIEPIEWDTTPVTGF